MAGLKSQQTSQTLSSTTLPSQTLSSTNLSFSSTTLSYAEHKVSLRQHLQRRLGESLRPFGREDNSEANAKKQKEEQKYWSWARKLKTDVEPHFKMPYNPDAGGGGGPEKLRELNNKEREKEEAYNRWLSNVQETQEEGMEARLAQLTEEDRKRYELARQRGKQLYENKESMKEAEREYWDHMKGPFQPTINIQGLLARSESELSLRAESNEKKLSAFAEGDHRRWAEHLRFVKSVRKPSGHIPEPDKRCLSPKQRNKLIDGLAGKKKRELSMSAEGYQRFLTNMEERQAERINLKTEETKQRIEHFSDREQIIAERTAALQEQQKMSDEQHRQFVQSLRNNAKSSPMLMEEAFLPPDWGKMHHHRQMRRRNNYDVDLSSDEEGKRHSRPRSVASMARTH